MLCQRLEDVLQYSTNQGDLEQLEDRPFGIAIVFNS